MKKIVFSLIFIVLPIILFADISVKDFGAKGDGITDDTKAFNDALQAAYDAGGGTVKVESGKYVIKGNIKIPASVTLEGTWRSAPLISATLDGHDGSILLAYAGRNNPDNDAFITFTGNASTVKGLGIIYPECTKEQIPPVPYPPCISALRDTNNVSIIDCALQNPYEAIKLVRSHRFFISNVQGYPTWRGIYVDECYDVGKIENIHFWPFGVAFNPIDPYCRWINRNAVAFEFAKSDWQYVTNAFCYGYGVGFKFSKSKAGACNGSFLSIGADACKTGILVEQLRQPGIYITNSNIVGAWENDCIGLEMTDTLTQKVSLVNCGFWGTINTAIRMDSPKGMLSVIATHFNAWGAFDPEAYCIDLVRGMAVINCNNFCDGINTIRIAKEMDETIISDNISKSGIGVKITNLGAPFVTLRDNGKKTAELDRTTKKHYTINIGKNGDFKYLRSWHSGENAEALWGKDRTRRWSSGESASVKLPAIENMFYTVKLDIDAMEYALDDKCGVYYNNKKIIDIKKGVNTYEAKIKTTSNEVHLVFKYKPWRPSDVMNSADGRIMGVGLSRITMQLEGANWKAKEIN